MTVYHAELETMLESKNHSAEYSDMEWDLVMQHSNHLSQLQKDLATFRRELAKEGIDTDLVPQEMIAGWRVYDKRKGIVLGWGNIMDPKQAARSCLEKLKEL